MNFIKSIDNHYCASACVTRGEHGAKTDELLPEFNLLETDRRCCRGCRGVLRQQLAVHAWASHSRHRLGHETTTADGGTRQLHRPVYTVRPRAVRTSGQRREFCPTTYRLLGMPACRGSARSQIGGWTAITACDTSAFYLSQIYMRAVAPSASRKVLKTSRIRVKSPAYPIKRGARKILGDSNDTVNTRCYRV